MNIFKKFLKKTIAVLLAFVILLTSFVPAFQTPLSPQKAEAAGESCSGGSGSPSGANLQAKVGGVALDQAATFLANMDDITGAYYDSTLDRIVFVGRKNTTLPEFDKDDLAVAIKSVIFNKTIPAVSMEAKDPNNPSDPVRKVIFYGGIEDTRFGKVLFDADYKLKQYINGYDQNGNKLTSTVPGYKSFFDRFLEKGPNPNLAGYSRWWLTPQLITLKQDNPNNAFVFDQVKMQVKTEDINPNNDPAWNEAAIEFAQQQTDLYDQFSQETPAYADAKQLGKIVSVIKWLSDNGIVTDFQWAQNYTPKTIVTPKEVPSLTTPQVEKNGTLYSITGGVIYNTANTYNSDNGTSASLKSASEAVNAPKEDINWSFTKDGQAYESVAVAADAFRTLGSYNTEVTDMSFPTAGDLTLGLQRSYSSYSGGQQGIGRGWNFLPAQLVDNAPSANGWTMEYCPATDTYLHRKKLAFQSSNGVRETFTYVCGTGYVPDDSSYHSKISSTQTSSTRTLYQVTEKNQTVSTFEELYQTNITNYALRLVDIKDKNGNTLTYNYDASNRLTGITDNKGHTITLNYNSQNLITSAQDWSGRAVNYTYDDQGNLLTVTDPRGNVTIYTYDANFKLTSITDREGKTVVTNTYTPEAKLATQVDAASLTTTYSYDDTNKAINISDSLGRSQKTTYDTKARVLAQTDPLLKSATYTYGTELAPLTIKDKNNNTTTYIYDANGNLTSVTYPDTKKVLYEYDSQNRVTKITDQRYGATDKVTNYIYDGVGNLSQRNESGQLSAYTYDSSGELLTFRNPLNNITTWTRDSLGNKLTEADAANKTASFAYDTIGRRTKQTDANAKIISYTYDSNGNDVTRTNADGTTTNIYDKENRLTKTTLPNNTITEYSYTNASSLNSVKDTMNNLTSYSYDSYQNLTTQTDALNRVTTNIYDNLNRQTQSTTPLGSVAKWEYDANGNMTKRIDANNAATTYLYDAFNRLTKITYPDTKTVTNTYDNRGNMTKMVDPIGTTDYTYDTFDRLLTVTNPYGQQITYTYDAADNLTQVTYPDGRIVTYIYDANNRLSSTQDWNNQTTAYTYADNGLLATRSMPNGVVSTYGYDAANRLASLEHNKSGTTLAKFTYERDSIGNITKVTEQGSFLNPSTTPTPTPTATPTPTPTTSGQDLIITGISTTPTSPNAGSSYTLSVKVKNQGTGSTGSVFVRIPYYYDLASAPTTATPINYSYSTTLNLAVGQETTLTINSAAAIPTSGTHTIWAYVDRDNAVPETNENNNAGGPLTIQVNPAATPTNTPTPIPTAGPTATPTPTPTPGGSNPDLIVTTLTTNPAIPVKNQPFTIVTTVKNQGTVAISNKPLKIAHYYDLGTTPTYTTTANASYTPAFTITPGASQTFSYGGGVFSTSGPHTIRVLVDQGQALVESNETNNAGGPVSFTIASTGALNSFLALLTIPTVNAQQVNPQFVTNFTYDPLARLLTANYPDTSNFTYTYNSVDNRLTQNVATPSGSINLSYNYNNDNQLTGLGTGTFTYDNNGNQTQKTNSLGATSYLYNFENRLTKYTPPTGSATTYTYDGNNNRLAKAVGSTTTRFVSDISSDLPRVLAETNIVNSISKSYIYGTGLISQGGTTTTSRNYYLEDGQGNIRFVTDSTGAKLRSTEYDPFGNWRAANGQSNIQMLYQGQQQDPESNLYYLRARQYDPLTGRFLSKDPIKGKITQPLTQNPYAYSFNNPINYSDPSGLWTVDLGLSAGSGWAGIEVGLQLSQNGLYSYGGVGVAQPGPGISLTYSKDDPSTGISTSAGGGLIVGGSASLSTSGNISSQVGLTTPGYGAYAVRTNQLICF